MMAGLINSIFVFYQLLFWKYPLRWVWKNPLSTLFSDYPNYN